MDNETLCEKPHWAAAVDGYTFRRGQLGPIVARCAACKAAFTVTEANAEAVRGMMIIHPRRRARSAALRGGARHGRR